MLDFTKTSIAQLESDKVVLSREKNEREVEIEDALRQVKTLDDQRSSLAHLKSMELHTMKSNHEQSVLAKRSQIKQLQVEIDLIADQISKSQDAILSLQKTKLKDVA